MALTINTNLSSMIIQKNLTKSTDDLNQAIQRMTTGYKINKAADNAAGYSIAKNWETQLSSLDIAADNAATGADMLATLEDNYALMSSHVQRVRDLTEQAANGTYGEQSKAAIQSEIAARLEEINRIAANCEFNGISLMSKGSAQSTNGIDIQVGIDGSAEKSQIHLDASLFAAGDVASLFTVTTSDPSKLPEYKFTDTTPSKVVEKLSNDCAGLTTGTDPADMLQYLDRVLDNINSRVTTLGAAQNRIDSAIESIDVQAENITSSLSTLRDADVAEESSKYIQAQILQQASATLLATANQSPSIALNLL